MDHQKFTFVVDIVTDSPVGINVADAAGSLASAIAPFGSLRAVHPVKIETLKEQGLKVWAKRVAGISLATPKVKKVKAPKAEAAEVAAVEAEAVATA